MNSNLEKIDNFNNLSEFNRFVDWINGQINTHTIKEIPVKLPYMGATSLKEKWFLHIESDEIWRLVWPDPLLLEYLNLCIVILTS